MAKRLKKFPPLAPLAYGRVYCELCRETINVGAPVGWWPVQGRGGRKRSTAYCATCQAACVRAGKALR
jgi:hypothetical protein